MTRRLLVLASLAALFAGVAPIAVDAASASGPACVVKITAMQFHPRHVAPGGSSVVHLKVKNCTREPQKATLTWLGEFTGPTPGIPAGCPAIDPLGQPLDLGPRGALPASLGYLVFPSCTATGLSATARITGADGTVLAEKTALLRIS